MSASREFSAVSKTIWTSRYLFIFFYLFKGRIDTFSASFIKENWGKIPRMVKGILKTYHTVNFFLISFHVEICVLHCHYR